MPMPFRPLAVAFIVGLVSIAGARGEDDRPINRVNPAAVQQWADQVAQEVERLQEDIDVEITGPARDDLYRRADAVLDEVQHFEDSLRAGASGAHLYHDFTDLDGRVRDLLDALRALGSVGQHLRHSAAHVAYADQQLQYALSLGPPPEAGRQAVERQVNLFVDEARNFYQLAQPRLRNDRAGRRLADDIARFAGAAEHFHRSFHAGYNLDHLRHDFAETDRAWHRVIDDLNAQPPRHYAYLRSYARRVDAIHANLHQLLALRGRRPEIIIHVGPPGAPERGRRVPPPAPVPAGQEDRG